MAMEALVFGTNELWSKGCEFCVSDGAGGLDVFRFLGFLGGALVQKYRTVPPSLHILREAFSDVSCRNNWVNTPNSSFVFIRADLLINVDRQNRV